ncbi:DUF221 domain protein, putative [Talaromyces stipitatus ATCC 10500]|uniref:DUF221 domain protein, putative n=1 Tax=Talaromyces stipitatus (strain ATCC 10500 / CBS 375.48 / QM 6759 / NRRL 1006) TaxID=441959 RepID=B8LT35_TALSN|nr:DUF221 domain protein, putative [Talaromyces stipitatus ATCC 10500]EED23543.1 DUF221 domain protein, putative [Talaromyces stipitatus ATCC 10500]
MSTNDILDGGGATGDEKQGISVSTFVASLATGAIVFAIEALLFLMLKGNLRRIYQPRTYLVPDRERTKPPAPGLFGWVYAVFQTTNAEFIQKCGLDAYFFLRYLRMLLKIFVPLGLVILPILIPINKVGGKDNNVVSNTNSTTWNVTGMDQLAWGNITPEHTDRYWAHLVLAVLSILYVCAVFFDELRGYIRLRQAYLTSPQHRLRASATTVLVTAIPKKWLSVEALTNLYDVFPGGIRNIWINRQLDELNEKVKLRDKLALALEEAETNLIVKCKKAQMKKARAEARKAGKKATKEDEKQKEETDKKAAQLAMQSGISSGNPHQVAHNVQDALKKNRESQNLESQRHRKKKFIPLVGGGLNAVGNGANVLEKKLVGGIRKANQGVEQRLDNTPGFAILPEESISSRANSKEIDDPRNQYLRPSLDSHGGSVNSAPEEVDQQPSVPNQEQSSRRPDWSRKSSSNSKRGSRTPEADEIPLTEGKTRQPGTDSISDDSTTQKKDGQEYRLAYNEDWQEDCGEPLWKKYIRQKDRETMRLPIFGLTWMPSIPLIGKRVDTIDYCRKEVARLNLEIEIDQQHPEKFPLMNSAFIQFNHQVAAHMACQAVSHHVPKQMAPRVVEISPDDVIWDNMSMKWWERYLRSGGIFIVVCGMVAGWAIPVAFTGLLSQLSYLEGRFSWLEWLSKLPHWLFSAIQGVLPPLFLSLLMVLLPVILRFLSQTQGLQTGMSVELMVSNYYFAFLFVQLFLVVAISSSFSTLIDSVTNITGWPELLAENIPKSSNYFFSYMILRAMSVSAGALAQILNLIKWFILGPLFDNTARNKWARTTDLHTMRWGSFFPVYTTLACIGLIYIIVAPLIVIFIIATFALFWFVYRYNTLYVTKFRFDTGGLLFPKAINQMFTGLYVMELCLIGLFFLVRDEHDRVACQGQAIVMIIVLILTLGYQYFLNEAFSPLIRYLPITLEDDAVRRDEEFARAQRIRHGLPVDDEDEEDTRGGLSSTPRQAGYDERDFGTDRKEIELQDINRDSMDEQRRDYDDFLTRNIHPLTHTGKRASGMTAVSWADRSRNRRSKYFGTNSGYDVPSIEKLRQQLAYEAEDEEKRGTGTNPVGRALFAGIHDELEDLTPDERDQLVQRAFQHEALRAKRPVIWIPRDDLGVSDDEIYSTQRFSKHLWISNEYQALDGKCRTIFSRSPPDFSEVDLIQL